LSSEKIDADPVPDQAYCFDAVPDVDPGYRTKMKNANPDSQHGLEE
jgi:hypothetical protein